MCMSSAPAPALLDVRLLSRVRSWLRIHQPLTLILPVRFPHASVAAFCRACVPSRLLPLAPLQPAMRRISITTHHQVVISACGTSTTTTTTGDSARSLPRRPLCECTATADQRWGQHVRPVPQVLLLGVPALQGARDGGDGVPARPMGPHAAPGTIWRV